MKKFCKKTWVLFFLSALWAFSFTSCSMVADGDDEVVLKPDTSRFIVHKLFPNDMAKNDSASVNVARGIMLVVHPGASYKLSFDVDSTMPAPELQLFRPYSVGAGLFNLSKVRTLAPTIVDNRYVYSFNCEEKEMTVWYTSLGVDGQYYEGEVNNISFTGIGSNSENFAINLVVVGAVEKTKDGMELDEFSRYMLSAFREKYYGVQIDTLYVRYAHEHPTLGSKYQADYPWIAGINSDDVFLGDLASSIDTEHHNTLNIFLVNRLKGDNLMGLSRLFVGALGAYKDNAIVVGQYFSDGKGKIVQLSSYDIVMTMVHESGHFFGLRHTSATSLDMKQYVGGDEKTGILVGDWSNIEDGMTDTPFCDYVLRYGYDKGSEGLNGVSDVLPPQGIYECKDLDNIMFPINTNEHHEVSFTKQQMDLIRSTLSIIPH